MTNLNKVRGLSPSERGLLVQSILLLPVIHLALLLLGFARLRQVMERLAPLKPINRTLSETESLQRARETARIISIAAQYGLYKATCLRKSMLVWWFLRRDEIPSQLCFGVRILDHKLEAHAWVEWDGRIINDSANVREQYQSLHNALPATRLGL